MNAVDGRGCLWLSEMKFHSIKRQSEWAHQQVEHQAAPLRGKLFNSATPAIHSTKGMDELRIAELLSLAAPAPFALRQ